MQDKNSEDTLFSYMQEYLDREMEKIYSKKAIAYFKHPVNMGRIENPDGVAKVRGGCGDTMEVYLVITNDIIETIRYHTDGCMFTHLCGQTLASKVQGRMIDEALAISPSTILQELAGQLPPEHQHCAILAVSALYRAIGQYWVDWARP